MPAFSCPALERCLRLHIDTAAANGIVLQLPVNDADALYNLYDRAIVLLERALWNSGLSQPLLDDYHALFVELEAHIMAAGDDFRRRFVVVVPVADRPQQLSACLQSLVGMLQAFQYGRGAAMLSESLSVVIADDSREQAHIAENRLIATATEQQGLPVTYFGLQEQQALLASITQDERQALRNVIGEAAVEAFYHKGASVMRNITSLLLHRMAQQDEDLLFLFVDSDEQFHACTDPSRKVFTTNYFYHIDRIFRQGNVQVLTGKVVGDPPVSPAVMAATLLDDAVCFLEELAALDATATCSFHGCSAATADAAYHDMAGLFGFTPSDKPFRFQCGLAGMHNHAACLAGFAGRLNGFFDGEHPTRMTAYRHTDVEAGVSAARTVYTGNYVLSPAALQYFIPFAGLGLRMAGPVLGRLLQSGIGEAFVAANLPFSHTRTLGQSGSAEFRTGIDRSSALVDLSGEFERQFFGDVMLFTVIELVAEAYPVVMPDAGRVSDIVRATQSRMREAYAANQSRLLQRLVALEALLESPDCWWSVAAEFADTRALLEQFIASLHANFDLQANAFRLIDDAIHCNERHQAIVEALLAYQADRESWCRLLA